MRQYSTYSAARHFLLGIPIATILVAQKVIMTEMGIATEIDNGMWWMSGFAIIGYAAMPLWWYSFGYYGELLFDWLDARYGEDTEE